MVITHPNPTHTCPRRGEVTPFVPTEPSDGWYVRDGETAPRCTYCGSMRPDEFMDFLEAGGEVGPTDKSYKVYVHNGAYSKFYFQHLSDIQKTRFVELLNAKTFRISEPGHFYVLPFFCQRVPAPPSGDANPQ